MIPESSLSTSRLEVTLVQSRTLIAAGSIALFGGTILVGISFARLAITVFGTARFDPTMIVVLAIYSLVLAFLCYLDILCVVTATHPRTLIITPDGITEVRRDERRCELWKALTNPTVRYDTSGAARGAIYIDFERKPGGTFSLRVDIFPESVDNILALVQGAMTGAIPDEIEVGRRTQTANYLLLGFSAALIIFAVHFLLG